MPNESLILREKMPMMPIRNLQWTGPVYISGTYLQGLPAYIGYIGSLRLCAFS